MAAVAELSFLLFALINSIHAEERIVLKEKSDSYTFNLPEEADSCLISRFVGEEKLVLWNTSALWSENSTVPEDLKQRLSVFSRDNISMIENLTHSDSGKYQEKCWGNVTYEKNITIIVCRTGNQYKGIDVRVGETVDLPCVGAADNLDIQWLKSDSDHRNNIWTRVFGDSVTSVMDNVEGRSQVVKTSSGLRIYNLKLTRFKYYNCLVMNQQQCVSSHPVQLRLPSLSLEFILHTVGETAVLQCPAEFTDDQPPCWETFRGNFYNSEVGKNYSLVFSSLQINHSGFYTCEIYNLVYWFYLEVCSKSGPPAVELFSEGDNVTFRCRGWEEGQRHAWFIKSNPNEDRLLEERDFKPYLRRRLNVFRDDGLLILSNVSLEDTGEYWCAVTDPDGQCVSSSRTVLRSGPQNGEPSGPQNREATGMDFTLYRSLLLGLLVILCVVVVAVKQRTRRGEQRPAQTDS